MSTAATVPVLGPDGQVRMIPQDQAGAALSSGGRQVTRMSGPDGTPRWIPNESVNDALGAGGKLSDQDSGTWGWLKRTFAPQQVPGASIPTSFREVQQRLAAGRNDTSPLPGVSEGTGLRSALAGWVEQGPIAMAKGQADIAQGNIARGGTQFLSGVSNTMLPAAPFVAAAAPVQVAANVALGYGAGKLAKGGAALLGANPEQQDFAESAGSYAIPMAGSALLDQFGPTISRTFNNAVVRPAARDFQFGK